MIVEVAPAIPVFKTLHYIVPEPLRKCIQPGLRVLVPVGSRVVTGYILDLVPSSEKTELKEILEILDDGPLLSPVLLDLLKWVSRYYFFPVGKVVEIALPRGLSVKSRRQLIITDAGKKRVEEGAPPEPTGVLELFKRGKPVGITALTRQFPGADHKIVPVLVKDGFLEWKQVIGRPKGFKEEKWISLTGETDTSNTQEERVVTEFLQSNGSVPLRVLRSGTACKESALKRLEKRGIVSIKTLPAYRNPFSTEPMHYLRPKTLTAEQEFAVNTLQEAIRADKFSAYLLHGVTGSGKTEVYLAAIESALDQGKDAIVLVPEIALTASLEAAFLSRFGDRLAILHSGLSAGERLDEWRRIREGKARVVIGARSAVFAPFHSLGLIIVDEEHDGSYKQGDGLRYNGRDVAVMRASLERAVVVLGSATPSIQTMFNAKSGRYGYLSLPKRVQEKPLPPINIVDMREPDIRLERNHALSKELAEALGRNLERNDQSIIFLNRRGFSPAMQCVSCGNVLMCPNCSISLTYHAAEKVLLCHYCAYSTPALPACPSCKGLAVRELGWGTERIEAELKRLFPHARIARMDRDTTTTKKAHHQILKAVQERKIDILVGTQMVAKGHDFPHITLVGVISADVSLNLPDFRAAERTFQLLTQVSGRAGRGEDPGMVIIQTYRPEHYSIARAREHDFTGFYDDETALRRALEYPPYTRLVNLTMEGNSTERVEQYSKEAVRRGLVILEQETLWRDTIKIFGPAPAPVPRIKGKFRYQAFLKASRTDALHSFTRALFGNLRANTPISGVKLIVDVDPENVL
ncbi:MAG: primosomal protein N' [Pseudomonadota bacterium]